MNSGEIILTPAEFQFGVRLKLGDRSLSSHAVRSSGVPWCSVVSAAAPLNGVKEIMTVLKPRKTR
jgi:hypothetical protein